MTHAAESTHWYTREGGPAYTVKAKDGTDRPATLRDARKLNLVPSVTAIIRCAAAPGLQLWMQRQAILAALTLPRRDDEPEDAYLARILSDSKEQARKAAERGTAIHAAIQGHYEGVQPSEADWPYVQGAMKAVGLGVWEPEIAFAHPMGFGGKVDLRGNVVIDFKTKDFGPDDKLDTWPEHHMQLAAYREGLYMPEAMCAIVYVSVTNPGLARLIEIPEAELAKGWKCFQALLAFYQAKNSYNSAFETVAA